MELIIPDFTDPFLEQLTACATFHADDPSRLAGIDELRLQARHEAPGGAIWFRLLIDSEQDGLHGHVHFDIAREGIYESLDSLETIPFRELGEHLERFVKQEIHVHLRATYSVPAETLPRRGIIRTLLGVATHSCGSDLCLDGASMSIAGDAFTRVRWNFDEGTDCIEVQLDAETISEFGSMYLSALIELMRDGLDCFVLEKPETRGRHATISAKSAFNLPEVADA